MADLNLPANPTVADIEQEILFHHVVLASLDPDEWGAAETEVETKDKIRRLNDLLDQRNDLLDQRNAAATPGRKRARVASVSDARDESARGVKSHRGSPRAESPDSDDEIEFLLSQPIVRGVEQQRAMEQMLAQQREQLKRDAELAKVMAHSTPNFGGNMVQSTLGRSNSVLGLSQPDRTPTKAYGQNLVLRSPQQTNGWQPQQSAARHSLSTVAPAKPFNFDDAIDVKQRHNSVPYSLAQHQSPSSNETRATATSDSDDSLEEISAADFQLNPRSIERKKQPPVQQSPMLQYPNTQQPNGFGRPPVLTQFGRPPAPYAFTPSSTLMRPQPLFPVPFVPGLPPVFGGSMNLPAFGSSANPLRGFGDVVGSALGAVIDHFEAGPSSQPDPHSYLYSDPTRNAEEIQQLLKNIRPDEDLPAELRKGTPPEMATTLLEHQKLGLTWLTRQEEGTNKGGILADDMGLGKTIQAIALMVSRRAEDERKTTLIVGPVALLGQWQGEIEDKVKSHYKMSIFRYHGTKCSWNKLKNYDVVLTTYGTLGSEWKKLNEWEKEKMMNPDRNHVPLDLPLTGKDSKWYRVILDEAQNIKNRNSNAAKGAFMLKSVYRLCMTGTPMMNNVTELYALIRFCRIKPFDHWETFNNEIGRPLNVNAARRYAPDQSMRKLRGLLCAIMLRRTKKSTLDGKPLINLPEREVADDEIELTSEEDEFYKGLETKAQGVINGFMSNGTLGKKYIHALVMLLRLRQACCHPKLVTLLEENTQLDVPLETLLDLAMQLGPDVVGRIKAGNGEFECPICLEPTFNPVILLDCGHTTCSECFSTMKQNAEVDLPCPVCRGTVQPQRVTDYTSFKKVHEPEKVTDEERQLDESTSDTDSESDGSDDEGSLRDFVVNDDDGDDEGGEDEQLSRKKKGKRKAKDKPSKSLAQLKKEGYRNQKARRRYIRRLRKDYKPSSKITRTLELLGEIDVNNPAEKVLIFSQFTTLLDLLEVALEQTNRRFKRYDGSMSGKDRAAAVEEFRRDPLSRLMLVSLKAGNAGLNLNFASQVIILDPFWNPYIEDQAIDRAHRIGQRYNVIVHRVIVPGTVEDRILKLQSEKRELINDALDEMESKNIGRLGQRDLAFLFGLAPR